MNIKQTLMTTSLWNYYQNICIRVPACSKMQYSRQLYTGVQADLN